MATQLRISAHLKTMRNGKVAFTAFRFVMYGMLGIFLEIASFPVTRIGRQIPIIEYLFAFDCRADPRLGLDGPWHSPIIALFGQSSLWMVPIYAVTALAIENLYRRWLFERPLPLRLLLYAVAIHVLEWATGLGVKALTGYAIWMYYDGGNIMHMTSLFSLPIWLGIGLVVELIYRELMDPDLRTALEAKLSRPQLPPR